MFVKSLYGLLFACIGIYYKTKHANMWVHSKIGMDRENE